MASMSLKDIAFPILNDTQMGYVESIGDLLHFEVDQELIPQGQRDYPFYVIKSGTVRIAEKCGASETRIASHGSRSFTGDVDMLTGRSSVIAAIADEPVDAYRLCAWRLRKLLGECPKVSEMLLEAFQLRRKLLRESPFVGVRVIGAPGTKATSRLQEFFYKNHVPHTFFDAGGTAGREQLDNLDAHELEHPIVHSNGHTVGNPSLPKLAQCIGISRDVDQELFDLVIVGSGPAGLAASVYAASEGLKTLVIDSVGPGGQAGSSSNIENFMGFPSGLSGSDLANRGYLQALKFGAQFIAPITVRSIESTVAGEHHLHLCTGQIARARCVLVASGVSYRQLDLSGCRRFEGAGVFYAATSVEARACDSSTAIVVGGGNSAGQAAMYLANTAQRVNLLIRGNDLSKSMSQYLCKRIELHPNIEVLRNSEVVRIDGNQTVDTVQLKNNQTRETTELPCAGLFIFIGARPHTDWLPPSVALDEKGFVLTGSAVSESQSWTLERPPCDLETSVPGIMAAGDVRSGTTKRCGFAVGDGSLAVACVHRFLSGM